MEIINQHCSKQSIEANLRGEPISFASDGSVLSRQYDDKWDFSGSEVRANGKNSIVSFVATHSAHKKAIQDILAKLYCFYEEKDTKGPSSIQLHSWKLGLQHMAKALGSTDWFEIDTRQRFRDFKMKLKKMKLGKTTIEINIVTVINKLFESGEIKRVIDGRELTSLGRPEEPKQHIAIPIGMLQKLLSRVISMVETYHPYRHKISQVMQDAYNIQELVADGNPLTEGVKKGRPITSNTNRSKEKRARRACKSLLHHNIPDFEVDFNGVQLGVLQVSCAMVTLAFSGVRIGELVSFNPASYKTKTTDEGKEISVLSGKISKSNNGRPKTETWQTHPIAKDALELAYDMTETIRKQHKVKIESMFQNGQLKLEHYKHAFKEVETAFIPVKIGMQKNVFVKTGMSRSFYMLAKAFGVKATEEDVAEFNLLNPSRTGQLKKDGYLPKLTPHDFRRTFAVFFKRYGFGTAAGIKFQYKHANLNMSDYYANNADLMRMHDVLLDTDLLQIMQEEGIKVGVEIYDDIFNNSAHLSGEAGDRIAEDKFKKMQAGHKVYMYTSEIEPLIRNGSISVVRLPTGAYCTNPECERLCGMGLFAGAKRKCTHTVNTDKSAKVMARQRKRDIDKFRGLNTGDPQWNSILARIKQNIKELEIVLRKHEIKFEQFDDRVRGLINV